MEEFAYAYEKKCRNYERLEGEKTTLQEFIARWTAEKAQQELQPSTIERYEQLINGFILPALGHRETSATMDIYSHSLQTAEQEAANKIEQLLTKQA